MKTKSCKKQFVSFLPLLNSKLPKTLAEILFDVDPKLLNLAQLLIPLVVERLLLLYTANFEESF